MQPKAARALKLAQAPNHPPTGTPWFKKHYMNGRKDHLRQLLTTGQAVYDNYHGDPSRHSSYKAGWFSVTEAEIRYMNNPAATVQQAISSIRQQLGGANA